MNWKRFFAAVFALLVVLSLGSTRLISTDVNYRRHRRCDHQTRAARPFLARKWS